MLEKAEIVATPAVTASQAPLRAAAIASAPQAVQRMSDMNTLIEQRLILGGGLPPIAEALIKTLALKARQGTLSEDKAFELLGVVRLL